MNKLDAQLFEYYEILISDIKLKPHQTHSVASSIELEIENLKCTPSFFNEVNNSSPVSLRSRLDELIAYQAWSDFAFQCKEPFIARTNVTTQSYICFVYLKDAIFEIIARKAPDDSISKKCASYLSFGKVRDFRNAFSHANWEYSPNFDHLECWVLEDAQKKSGPMRNFQVKQYELNFWQTLSRGIGYSIYQSLLDL